MNKLQRLIKNKEITVIGITGGVGSGKSKVLEFMEQRYGAIVYKADEIGHKVMEKGTDCYHKILECFGDDILSIDGEIDRKKIANIIFNDENKLNMMNSFIHPSVEKYIINHIINEYNDCGHKLYIIEAALLIEAGYKQLATELWYVFSDKEKRIERLINTRGYSREKCLSIMRNQLSDKEFRQNCDYVIDNSMDFNNTKNQIEKRMKFCYNYNID